MYYLIAGFIAYLLIILYTRNIDNRNLKLLEKDQIAVLFDIMAGLRKYTLGFLALFIAGFLLLSQFSGLPKQSLLIGYLILYSVFILIGHFVRMKKLRQSGLPDAFIRDHRQSSLLKILGQSLLMLALYMQFATTIQ